MPKHVRACVGELNVHAPARRHVEEALACFPAHGHDLPLLCPQRRLARRDHHHPRRPRSEADPLRRLRLLLLLGVTRHHHPLLRMVQMRGWGRLQLQAAGRGAGCKRGRVERAGRQGAVGAAAVQCVRLRQHHLRACMTQARGRCSINARPCRFMYWLASTGQGRLRLGGSTACRRVVVTVLSLECAVFLLLRLRLRLPQSHYMCTHPYLVLEVRVVEAVDGEQAVVAVLAPWLARTRHHTRCAPAAQTGTVPAHMCGTEVNWENPTHALHNKERRRQGRTRGPPERGAFDVRGTCWLTGPLAARRSRSRRSRGSLGLGCDVMVSSSSTVGGEPRGMEQRHVEVRGLATHRVCPTTRTILAKAF